MYFYTEKLGFKILWRNRSGGYVSFAEADGDRPVFAIFPKEGVKDYPGYVPLPERRRKLHIAYGDFF